MLESNSFENVKIEDKPSKEKTQMSDFNFHIVVRTGRDVATIVKLTDFIKKTISISLSPDLMHYERDNNSISVVLTLK